MHTPGHANEGDGLLSVLEEPLKAFCHPTHVHADHAGSLSRPHGHYDRFYTDAHALSLCLLGTPQAESDLVDVARSGEHCMARLTVKMLGPALTQGLMRPQVPAEIMAGGGLAVPCCQKRTSGDN
jgi:hypothetical protein